MGAQTFPRHPPVKQLTCHLPHKKFFTSEKHLSTGVTPFTRLNLCVRDFFLFVIYAFSSFSASPFAQTPTYVHIYRYTPSVSRLFYTFFPVDVEEIEVMNPTLYTGVHASPSHLQPLPHHYFHKLPHLYISITSSLRYLSLPVLQNKL